MLPQGGIDLDTLPLYMAYQPEIIIVGGGIVHADDPAVAAIALFEKLQEYPC